MNQFISTKMHGVADYLAGIVITASPWLFGFSDTNTGGAALFFPVVLGVLLTLMTIFTRHELGLIQVLPLQLHLVLDMIAGFLLLVSPFLYDFYPKVWLPHVLLGALLFGSALFTKGSPFTGPLDLLDERGMLKTGF
ncbi:SPW repeat domain-containing protein [Mucilaginibacter lacusdianchii]|uniref:SPW repeat domain-containing protein n=1 Tax=Mucilaginibacter lacusdianchii TaxID=2684211 RepID=UPI00131A95BE|nr:hypothetical protein [Mucilaginibacter sp. JXJ CY 39]